MNLLYYLVVHYTVLLSNLLLDLVTAVLRRYPFSVFVSQPAPLE